ncbi:unnamed protein product [Polarella glacialis]|uniref:Uncharacterized protein n=1 Tax=Polarella glacialis TaxID=89957 RepID=A0A813FBN6_POLGL|nr:unnamed protein product [Polarella glacialis]
MKQKGITMPRSLEELQQAARLHFKANGKCRFYTEEGREIAHGSGMAGLRDGEVITVIADKRAPFQGAGSEDLQSTFKAHYIYPVTWTPRRPANVDSGSVLTEATMKAKLDGQSSYARDYVRPQAVGVQNSAKSVLGQVFSTHFLQHSGGGPNETTYKSNFKRHQVGMSTPRTGSDGESTLTNLSKGHRFDGQTSYSADYCKAGIFRSEAPVIWSH